MLLVFRRNAAGLAVRGAVAGVLPWGTPAGAVSRKPAGQGLICGAATGAGLSITDWTCSPARAELCRHARVVKRLQTQAVHSPACHILLHDPCLHGAAVMWTTSAYNPCRDCLQSF